MTKKFWLILLAGMAWGTTQSQEYLKPLSANLNYHYPQTHTAQDYMGPMARAKAASVSLTLPFREDFFYAYKNQYPRRDLWADSLVYVNHGMGINPMSYGVATFDGLNRHGYPYTPSLVNLNVSLPADTLTSLPINLSSDSQGPLLPNSRLGLSFFYQAGGHGDYPEAADSLVLDFYKPNQNAWVSSGWSVGGKNITPLNDTLFKRAIVWINDTAFLRDGFRFRFRNFANTAADFDHWNLDYLILDRNQDTLQDSVFADITFVQHPRPFLKSYSAMPHKQYVKSEMAGSISLNVRSNESGSRNCTYNYYMTRDANNLALVENKFNSYNIGNYKPNGYLTVSRPIDSAFYNPGRNYDYPVKHTVVFSGGTAGANQIFKDNDTVVQYNQLRNFYGFDDGSAEKGYYVLGTAGKMAVKITLNQVDTIVGAQIYFEHVGNLTTTQQFKLNVWAAGSSGPGALLFSDTARVVYPKKAHRAIPEYTFTTPLAQRILIPGSYYVGIQQLVASGISVGYDMNYDFSSALYFDSGSGWQPSQFKGSVMIHPVFGSFNGTPIGVKETVEQNVRVLVFPNPANTEVNISSHGLQAASVTLFSLTGQLVLKQELSTGNGVLPLENLPEGIYVLQVSENGQVKHRQKLVVGR